MYTKFHHIRMARVSPRLSRISLTSAVGSDPTLELAESQGVEPCDHITMIYGLAIRCITILPTLHYIVGPLPFLNPTSPPSSLIR